MTRAMQANLGGQTYFTGRCLYLDWSKVCGGSVNTTGGEFEIVPVDSENNTDRMAADFSNAATWNAGTYLDNDYNLKIPATGVNYVTLNIYFGPTNIVNFPDYSGEVFRIIWTGNATITGFGGSISGLVSDSSGGHCLFTLNSSPDVGRIRLTLNSGDLSNPPRDWKIIRECYYDNTAVGNSCTIDGVTYPGYLQGGKFDPEYLALAKNFEYIRHLNTFCTNYSGIVDYSEIATESTRIWNGDKRDRRGPNNEFVPHYLAMVYPKGGMPLSLMCDFAEQTGAAPWFCLPHKITDAAADSIFTYFRDNLDPSLVPIFAYTNEPWNDGFNQYHYLYVMGRDKSGFDGTTWKYYGYRAAQLAKRCMDIYSATSSLTNRAKYKFVLESQTAHMGGGPTGDGPAQQAIDGVNFWKTEVSSSLNLGRPSGAVGLFDEMAFSSYLGDVVGYVYTIQSITKASNGKLTYLTDGPAYYANGDRVRIMFVTASGGMNEIAETTVTVSSLTDEGGGNWSFLTGVNTTGYSTFTKVDGRTLVAKTGKFHDCIDASIAKHAANPTAYPDEYAYYGQMIGESFRTGTSSDGLITTDVSLDFLVNTAWPDKKAIADDVSLAFSQYEGHSSHFIGTAGTYGALRAQGNTSIDQFNLFMVHAGHSKFVADVLYDANKAFLDMGGIRPSLFTLDDNPTAFGDWGAIRNFSTGNTPIDTDNPKWRSVLAMTGTRKRMQARAA